MASLRYITLSLVHLCALIGVLSLYGIAQDLFFVIFLLLYTAGTYADIKKHYPIKRWILNTFALILSGYFLSFIRWDDLIRPFANTVLLLLAVKSLEEKKTRDMYQILLLSLFAVSISTVYNLSLSFALLLLFEIALGVSSLVFINLYKSVGDRVVSKNIVKSYALVSVVFFLVVSFLAVPFFFLLPRTQTPLFDLFGKASSGLKTGIADSVVLGKVGQIQQDNTVAFRVYGLPKGLKNVYWRVSVFDTYVGNEWISTKKQEIPVLSYKGKLTYYTVLLEPTFEKYLPALDYPAGVQNLEGLAGRVFMLSGGVFGFSKEITRPVRYTAVSSDIPPLYEDPQDYTEVPKGVSKSIVELAHQLSKGAKDQEDTLKNLEKFFSKGFRYSLELGRYSGDPLEYFLFVSKKGNCEYYASATAILLRLMGIPARVVGGFKGSIWNDYGSYYVITNSMAHVWVEAYIKGRWLRVDTTPPYTSPNLKEVSKFSLVMDAVLSFWYSNVVGFSSEKQFSLFEKIQREMRFGIKTHGLRKPILRIFGFLLMAFVVYLLLKLYKSSRKTPENLYRDMLKLLKMQNTLLPEELLKKLKGSEVFPYAEYIVKLYQRHRFSPYKVYKDEVLKGYESIKTMKRLLRNNAHRF